MNIFQRDESKGTIFHKTCFFYLFPYFFIPISAKDNLPILKSGGGG